MNDPNNENLPIIEPNKDIPDKKQPNRINVSKALKLYLKGWNYSEIARDQQVTPSAVQDRLKHFTVFNKQGNDIEVYRNNEANLLDATRLKLLAIACNDSKLKAMSPYQAMGMYGIAFDKMRLLTGESTANVNQLTAIVLGSEKLHKQGYSEPVIPDDKQ